MWRLRPAVLRGALWAWLSVLGVRRDLRRNGLRYRPIAIPRLPLGAEAGVRGVLTRLAPTCLERALVWQAWLSLQGERHDVVIGVLATGLGPQGDPAHAWVDGADSRAAALYLELHRIPAANEVRN